jgi:hypothetical protein
LGFADLSAGNLSNNLFKHREEKNPKFALFECLKGKGGERGIVKNDPSIFPFDMGFKTQALPYGYWAFLFSLNFANKFAVSVK